MDNLTTFQKVREAMKQLLHDIEATMERYKKEDPELREIRVIHDDCKRKMKQKKQKLDRMDCPEELLPAKKATQMDAENYFHMVYTYSY